MFLCGLLSLTAQAQQSDISYDNAGQPPSPDQLMKWHEEFTYEVRYSFFKLGEVKLQVVSDTLYRGEKSWYLQAIIKSNSGIPFVGKEENHYSSIFRPAGNTFHVQKFWTDNVDEGEYKDSEYVFNRKQGKVYAHEKDQPSRILDLEDPAVSGPTVFFLSRLTAGSDSTLKLPIYLNREKKYMTLTNTTEKDTREYDAFDEPVETYYMKGDTDIDGPFGFSGEFESWYLADDLRVPVEARVKVWLGNAKVKLIDYKKELRTTDD